MTVKKEKREEIPSNWKRTLMDFFAVDDGEYRVIVDLSDEIFLLIERMYSPYCHIEKIENG
jgi:hypothetical protein